MKVLTLLPLWAWTTIHGPKRVENRTWSTTYRGPVAIHAGNHDFPLQEARRLLVALGYCAPDHESLPRGAILGVVDLVDCVAFDPSLKSLAHGQFDEHGLFGDRLASGPFCWIFQRPRPLAKPIAWRGRMGKLPQIATGDLAALLAGTPGDQVLEPLDVDTLCQDPTL